MKDLLYLRILYKTAFGRLLLKMFVQPRVSQKVGQILSCGASRWLVPYYIRKHDINMDDIEIPEEGFSSFNEFFTRKRNGECPSAAKDQLISPCYGFLTPVRITKDTVFEVKHTQYYLCDLLKNRGLARKFEGGTALIFRLTPANYHRYCYPAKGKLLLHRQIPGKLHCVRPVALSSVPVFIQNSREFQVIKTQNFGTMVQMEVGALLVGKIENHRKNLSEPYVQAGEEKGYFEFGGSTIILLLQKDKIHLSRDLRVRRDDNGEIPVHMGEVIALSV